MFALVDCNNFYVSCERVFNPKLIGKPVAILSNNDGCVIARSNEAKALGIPMGAPYFQYARFMEAHNFAVLSSNYTLYGDFSRRVMQVLREFTPDMQVYSIDEAFLMLNPSNPLETAQTIRKRVIQWTGIPVSIGIAPTKTLAKIANHFAKKNRETGGIHHLAQPEKTNQLLKKTPVTEIWGIGRQSGDKLNRAGIYTALDLKNGEDGTIRRLLTVVGLRTAMELRGLSCLPLEEVPPPKKAICSSRAFGRPVDTPEELCEAVASYTARAAEKVRSQGSLASILTVFIELHPFRQGSFHVTATLPEPTAYTPHLTAYGTAAAKSLFREGHQYRKAGVILDGLVPDHCYQQDLFTPKGPAGDKQKKVMQVMDSLNEKHGHTVLHTAAEGIQKEWKMKRGRCTPRYTTDWKDLLKIHI